MPRVKINPAEFKQIFRFEGFTKTPNDSSGHDEEPAEYFTTRGKWEQLNGQRVFEDGQELLVNTYRATCFWRSALEGLLGKDTRLIYDNRLFRIERAERVNEDRQYYQFTLTEAH